MRPSLPTVLLRAPGPAERAVALDLIMAFHAEEADPLSAETAGRALDLILAGDPLVRLWLIEAGGEVAGYVCLGLGFSIEIGGRDFWIDDLYVRPERRGQGIGTAALARVEMASRALGARRLCLEVRHGNHAAGRLYVRGGYIAHARSLMSKALETDIAPPDGASVDLDQ